MANGYTEEVVCETGTEEQWTREGGERRGDGGRDGGKGVGGNARVVGGGGVVEKVKNTTEGQC